MVLRVFWLIALLLGALTTAMSFCHLLEMLPRLAWGPELWIGTTVTGGLYWFFGTIGAVIETGNWAALGVLAAWLRREPPAVFRPTALAAALFLAAFVLWWGFVFPVNAEIAGWSPQSVPADWQDWRAQWEFAHAARAALHLAGLTALYLGVIAAIPRAAAQEA